MSVYEIAVPGRFVRGVAFLDLETEKVPTPAGFRLPSGEPLRRRWAMTLAAVARDGLLTLVDCEGSERAGLAELSDLCVDADRVVYAASRQFDEMVVRGRFTNARRAHLPRATWPSAAGSARWRWENVRKAGRSGAERGVDVASRLVPSVLRSGGDGWERCAIHCLRDACDLVLAVGAPDRVCSEWLRRFLGDYAWARAVLLSEPGMEPSVAGP